MHDVPVFFDKSEPQQVQELRVYIKSKGSDISEESTNDVVQDLVDVINESSVCWQENIVESELESIFNSIVSLIYVMPTPQSVAIIDNFCEQILAVQNDKRHLIRLKLLNNLLNGIDDSPNLSNCYTVYISMVKLAGKHNLMSVLNPTLNDIRSFFDKWNTPIDKQQLLLSTLHQSFVNCKLTENATKIMIELLSKYSDDNASEAKADAIKCIVTSMIDPHTFIMDHLLNLKPVQALKGEKIYELLQIFVSGQLKDYTKFYESNKKLIELHELNHDQNMLKMRHLSFMDLCEDKQRIEFAEIEDKLDVSGDNIEALIIDVFRTKMVRGKIDYCNRCVKITSSCRRQFQFNQWSSLKTQLMSWKQNLNLVINNVNSVIKNNQVEET